MAWGHPVASYQTLGLVNEIGTTRNGTSMLNKNALIFSILFIGACAGSDGSNGPVSLVALEVEAAGDNCEVGGQKIQAGIDANGDGVLDSTEVASTRYVCDGVGSAGAAGSIGAAGADGLANLVTTIAEAPGTNCATGGTLVSYGLDDDASGTLEAAEVDGSTYVCNGADGADGADGTNGLNSIVMTTPEAPGNNCATGGTLISYGLDDDANGTLEQAEVDGSSYVCHGAVGAAGSNGVSTLVNSSPEQPGLLCAAGGTVVTYGLDDDASGTLEPTEVDGFYPICNGANGADGAAGAAGISAIMTTSVEAPGTNCAAGGTVVTYGGDDDADGTLQPTEVEGSVYVCNGEAGAVGAAGADGTDGGPRTVIRFDRGSDFGYCPYSPSGATDIFVGVDVNGNGILDDAEIDTGLTVCEADFAF